LISFSQATLEGYITDFFLPFARIMALIAVAPVLGNRSVPARIKIALGVLVTLAAAPVLPMEGRVPLDSFAGFLAIGREILIGVAMGLSVRVIFAAIEMGGEVAGLQMGLSFAGYIDPSTGNTSNAVSSFFGIMAVLLFLSLNGHLLLLSGVIESFQRLPIGGGDTVLISKALVNAGSQIFAAALSVSLPIIVVLLILNLGLGIMSRIAPQMNVFAVGFPISLSIGLSALVLLLPYLERPMRILLEHSTSALGRF
jgi:flagellar biosynthetic protein FliR